MATIQDDELRYRAQTVYDGDMVRSVFALALGLVACGPPQYDFVAPALPLANPSAGAKLVDATAVAVDGLTKHKWTSFTDSEACFDSYLSDLRAGDVVQQRPFLLMGFRAQNDPMPNVPTIRSSRITVKDSGQEDIKTEERRIALPHVDVEVCFENPGRVITPSTAWVVLRVPYSEQTESIGSAGSRDGVWRLTK